MPNMNKVLKRVSAFAILMLMLTNIYANETTAVTTEAVNNSQASMWSSPLFWIFVFAIFGLLMVIVAIGSVLVGLVNKKVTEKFGKGAAIITVFFLLASSSTYAQDAASSTTSVDAVSAVMGGLDPNTVIILSVVVFIELFVILYLYNILQRMLVALGYKEKKESAWSWKSISKRMTNAAPLERESDVATDHVYDGIRELDNSLPPWWVWMFYTTIAFSFVYVIYYHLGSGPTQDQEYLAEVELASIKKAESLKQTASKVDENTVVLLTDAADISKGKSSFITKCAACHGQNGEGGVGPNLTDEYWIHGGGIKNIFKTIKYGVQEKGMIAWEAQMQPLEMQQVSSFIMSLKGTNPANAKAPQGDLYKEEASPAATDSTASNADSSAVAMK